MGASALLIVFILLIGFVANRCSLPKYVKLLHYSGQHLYNKLLVNGAACFILGLIYCSIVRHWDADLFDRVEFLSAVNIFKPTFNDSFMVAAIVAAFLIALLWALSHDLYSRLLFWLQAPDVSDTDVATGWFDRRRLAARRYRNYVRHSDAAGSDPVRAQIVKADPDAQMMIFMSDRKVYIGCFSGLQFSADYREQLTHCLFSPRKSGYREKDTLEVNITTDYKERTDLQVLLKISDIVSIRIFSEEQFTFFAKRKERAERIARLSDLLTLDAKDYLVSK